MFLNWLARRSGAKAQRRAVSSSRLRLECLEDRATPATFNVTTTLDVVDPADGKRSLREAITAADNLAGADVIVLPAGVYKIALAGAGEDGNATGDFDVIDSVTIRGAGRNLTFIDGQQIDRVFDVFGTAPGSIRVVLERVAVRGGNVAGDGGGIGVGNADLVFRDAAVTGNRASVSGGGISNRAAPGTGNVTLVRTIVGRNVAGGSGGGLDVAGTSVLTLKDSTVRRNIAGSFGGGIFAVTANLTNCTVSGNTARSNSGGGIVADQANLTNSTVSGNSAATLGGGIDVITATLTNSTVSGNTAGTDGGGLRVGTATLLNCTVVENIAHTGGGIFHEPGVGTFSVKNTIIALNLVDFTGTGPDVSGEPFTSQGHNLIGDSTGGAGFTNAVTGDIVGTAANPIDPKLGPLANNGGKTRTHALKAASPAIDRGDNSLLPPTDQRGDGFPRVKDGNGDGAADVDIGAFER